MGRLMGDFQPLPMNAEEEAAGFRALLEAPDTLVALFDPQGRLLRFSPACEAATGYRTDEVRGRLFWDLFLLPSEIEAAREAFAHDGLPRRHESLWRRKDGEQILIEWVYARSAGMRIALGQDVTQRRRQETERRQAQKMESVGRMASGITHDFNNLLTVIGGYADLIDSHMEDGHPDGASVTEIRKACARAAQLTRRLLAFSRQQILEPEVLDLTGILEQMESLLPRVLGDPIRVEMSLPDVPVWIRADAGQIDQVLLNLSLNARDAMPRGGVLQIRLDAPDLTAQTTFGNLEPGPHARLTVKDSGHGMDARTLAHLFEPFFTTKPAGEGTGLGLSTVFGIVRQSGGEVRVDSAPGKGASFEITLPRLREGPATPPPRRAGAPLQGGSETVLLVEDSAPLRTLLGEVLRSHGYKVLEAAHGDEALRLSWKYEAPIHLLLTDVSMPHLDGRELARLLSASRPGLRTVFATGRADLHATSEASFPPGAPLLLKPFACATLIRKLRELLDTQG